MVLALPFTKLREVDISGIELPHRQVTYFKVGQYTAFNGIQGRRHGNLRFAGEHTSVNFQGFMEGALRSGYRCAREIAS